MNYFEIHQKRLNRYGNDYQSRIQGQRERNFENYLAQSIYRVDCVDANIEEPPETEYFSAVLERNRQDYSETQAYLLTPVNKQLSNGTVLRIFTGFLPNEQGSPSLEKQEEYWMVWWVEEIAVSGYNKYVVLKMTHQISWDNKEENHWAFLSGPGTQTITDTTKSTTVNPLYRERTSLYMFVTPYAADLKKESYLEVSQDNHKLAFVVTDVDFISTKGVLYVSIDPSYERDDSEKPKKPDEPTKQESEEFYWLDPTFQKEGK